MTHFQSIQDLLRSQAQRYPTCLVLWSIDGPEMTYWDLDARVRGVATQLAQWDLRRSDRLAIALPNGQEMAVAVLAAMSVGIAAPLNPAYRKSEFGFYLEDLAASAVIISNHGVPDCVEAAEEIGIPIIRLAKDETTELGDFSLCSNIEPLPVDTSIALSSDVALVLHTSGTTARPKMVPLSHQNLCASANNVARSLSLGSDDTCLNVMPLFHIHGLVAGLLASLAAGATVVCTPGFSAPHFFSWLKCERPTWYTAVPTMHQAVLSRADYEENTATVDSRLRFIRSSSASLPPSVSCELGSMFGVPIVEAYGMTEAAHQITCNPLALHEQKPGSVGVPAGPEVAIADDQGRMLPQGETGEVVIRGPNLTAGFWGAGDHSTAFLDGKWFRTGDQGYFDTDGYLFLTGRLKEIVNRGGETIAPRQVEEALLQHPAVVQAVAFAVPDERLGEEVAAAVVLRDGQRVSEAKLICDLESVLSFAKLPKRILFLNEIPKGPTGKVQRIGMAKRLGIAAVVPLAIEDMPRKAELSDKDVPVRQETIDRLIKLWNSTLGLSAVGEDDQFLHVGGDSVTATVLVLRVRDEFGVDVPMAFFSASTVRRQAQLIETILARS